MKGSQPEVTSAIGMIVLCLVNTRTAIYIEAARQEIGDQMADIRDVPKVAVTESIREEFPRGYIKE